MDMSTQNDKEFCPGDLIRINTDGVILYRTPSRFTAIQGIGINTVGQLREDDPVIVVEIYGEMIKIVTRIGLGWVVCDNLSDLFLDEA